MTKVSKTRKIADFLTRDTSVKGVTPTKLSKLAKTTVDDVYRRVYQLRVNENMNIVSTRRDVAGKSTTFYKVVQ